MSDREILKKRIEVWDNATNDSWNDLQHNECIAGSLSNEEINRDYEENKMILNELKSILREMELENGEE